MFVAPWRITSFLFPTTFPESPSTSRRSVAALVATTAAGKILDRHHGARAGPKGLARGVYGGGGGYGNS